MGWFEIITLSIAILGLLVSIFNFFIERKNTKIQNTLNKELLNELMDKKSKLLKAKIIVELEKNFKNYYLVFKNVGNAAAFNINCTIEGDLELIEGKLPIEKIESGSLVKVQAIIYMGMKSYKWPIKIEWENEDESAGGNSTTIIL